jgi:hypothetical protein
MFNYMFELRGEDHTLFTWSCEASTREEAEEMCELIYPEATILDCHSQQELIEIEDARYQRLNDEYDNDYYYG